MNRLRKKVAVAIGSIASAGLIIAIAATIAFAIVYVPVPSYTLLSPTVPGTWVIGGTESSYYTIGFALPLPTGSSVTEYEPLPTINLSPDESAPTNPLSPLAQVWSDMWDVPIRIGWIVLSMFIAICTFIAISYYFQHIGFATICASIVIGAFSAPSVHILPIGCLIIAIFGVIAGAVVEAKA